MPIDKQSVSGVFVNLPAGPHRLRMDHALNRVEGVDAAIITGAQPAAAASRQPVMRKGIKPLSHVVDFRLDAAAHHRWQIEKGRVECGVVNPKRGLHWPEAGSRNRGCAPAAISCSDCRICDSNPSVNWRWSSQKSSNHSRTSSSSAGEIFLNAASSCCTLLTARRCPQSAVFPNQFTVT